MAECGRLDDRRHEEFYEDTCSDHPNGCHAVALSRDSYRHDTPAYKRPPAPGSLDAESYDALVVNYESQAQAMRVARQKAQDDGFAKSEAY